MERVGQEESEKGESGARGVRGRNWGERRERVGIEGIE